MGGAHHPLLGVLGLMSAKNTAVNLMILTTFLSFMLYKRGNKVPTVPWARTGNAVEALIFALAASIVIFYGIYGYFVPAIVRIGFSVYQVGAVLFTLIAVTVIDIFLLRNAQILGEIQWGKIRAGPICAVLAGAVLYLVDGVDGLCAVGPAHGLARLRGHARYQPRRLHADLGLRDQHGIGDGDHFPRVAGVYLLVRSLDEAHAGEEELDKDVAAAFRPPLRPQPVTSNPGTEAEG
jgi:hypothetical protein